MNSTISVFFLPGVPIFVEHLGDNLQFYPNFALFSTLGGMNLDLDFFQVSKSSEDQKKVFTKTGALFSPNSSGDLRSNAHPGAQPEIPNGGGLSWGVWATLEILHFFAKIT